MNLNQSMVVEKDQNSHSIIVKEVTKTLRLIGVPASLIGYTYIREAIIMTIYDVNVIHSITKAIYPVLAKKFNSTRSGVERAIRHAIEVAWERGDADTLQQYFGFTVSDTKGKPTNSEFIALIADEIRLSMLNDKQETMP